MEVRRRRNEECFSASGQVMRLYEWIFEAQAAGELSYIKIFLSILFFSSEILFFYLFVNAYTNIYEAHIYTITRVSSKKIICMCCSTEKREISLATACLVWNRSKKNIFSRLDNNNCQRSRNYLENFPFAWKIGF